MAITTRTQKSTLNVVVALLGHFIALIVAFFARRILLDVMGEDYVGLNGLFTNIISMFSLVELGFGVAIVYSLYKPLAENDKEKITLLMQLFEKVYIVVGIIVFLLGCIFTPFLTFTMKEVPLISNLRLYFFLYVINTAGSYFFSYKRTLLSADQKAYISNIYYYIFHVLTNVLQIVWLLIFKSFLGFIIIKTICVFIENILASIHVDKLYPYIKNKVKLKLDKETIKTLKKNIFAMFFHKVGAVVVFSTSSLLISVFIGLNTVGKYSNYMMVTSALTGLIALIFNALTASVGNLSVTDDKEKLFSVFKNLDFVCFWVFSFCSISLVMLLQPFVALWVGKAQLLPISTVILMVLSFYITGMRSSLGVFRNSLGLFYKDRYKPVLESVVNLIVSLILVKALGLNGVFLGTIISTILSCFWIEAFVVYKYGFGKAVYTYFIKYIVNLAILLVVATLTYFAVACINTSYVILNFVLKMIVCAVVPNVILIIINIKRDEFKYFWRLPKVLLTKNKQ